MYKPHSNLVHLKPRLMNPHLLIETFSFSADISHIGPHQHILLRKGCFFFRDLVPNEHPPLQKLRDCIVFPRSI